MGLYKEVRTVSLRRGEVPHEKPLDILNSIAKLKNRTVLSCLIELIERDGSARIKALERRRKP